MSRSKTFGASLLVAAAALAPSLASAQTITKAATGTELTTSTNWTGGAVPGASNIAEWSSTSLGAGLTLASSLTWQGINVTGALSDIAINAGSATPVLSIGSSGITLTGTRNLTLGSSLAFTANQSWSIAGGRTLTLIAASRNATGTGNISVSQSGTGVAAVIWNQNGNNASWSGYSGNITIGSNVKVQTQGNGAAALGSGIVTLAGGAVHQRDGSWTFGNTFGITADSTIGQDSSNGVGRLMKLLGDLGSTNGSGLTFTNTVTGGTRTDNVGIILAGANASTYGATTISANTRLRVGGNSEATIAGTGVGAAARGSLGTGAVSLAASTAELAFTRTDSHTVANAISGAGTVVIGGNTAELAATSSQVVTLSGASTYTGATRVSRSRLNLTGSLTSAITVDNSGIISGGGSTTGLLTLSSGSAIALAGGATTTSLTVNGATFSGSNLVTFLNAATANTVYDVFTYGNGAVTGISNLTVAWRGTLSDDTANKKYIFTAGSSGTRTWNTTTGTWEQNGAANFAEGDQKFYGGDTVVFGAIASDSAITLAGAIAPASVTVSNAANTYTFSGTSIAGAASLTKSGNGALVLSAAHTYSGGTSLSGGTLRIGNAASLGSGAVTVSGGTLDLAGFTPTNALTLGGSGNGTNPALWNSAATGVTLAGAVTLASDASVGNGSTTSTSLLTLGNPNLNGKKLTISAGAVSIDIQRINNGDIEVASGGTLYTLSGGALTSAAGTITVKTGGRMETRDTDNTAMTAVHGIVLDGGALSTAVITNNNGGGAGTILKNAITVTAAGGSLVGNNTSFGINLRLAGSLSGTGNLDIAGAQGVELRGDATNYTGTATVTAGTLTFNSASAQGFGGAIAGSRPVTKSGAGTLTLLGTNSWSGATTISAGILKFDSASNQSLAGAVSGAGNLTKVGNGTLTLSGIASLSGNVTVDGGTLVLGNNNTLTGTVTITSGTLQVGAGATAGFIGNGAAVTNNSRIVWNRQTDTNVGNAISGSGSIVNEGTGAVNLNGANTYSGTTTITSGTVRVGNAGTTGSLGSGEVINNSALVFNRSDAFTVANVISGTGTVTKLGASSVTLTGASTYTGATTVSNGTLVVGATGSLGSGTSVSVASGATLSVLSGGVVSGATSLASGATLTGSGTLGAVSLASGSSLATGASGVGTLTLGSLALGQSSADTVSLTYGVSGVSGSATITSSLRVNGDLTVNTGAAGVIFAFGSSLATLAGGSAESPLSYDLVTYTGAQLADLGAFTFTGTTGARQNVSLANGNKAIQLLVSAAFPIWKGTTSDWSSSTAWKLNSTSADTGFLTNDTVLLDDSAASGYVNLTADVAPLSLTFANDTLAYVLGSSDGFGITTGSVLKSGAASLTLNGSNSYAGGTTVTAGRLRVGSDSALGSGALALSGAAVSSDGATDRTLANALSLAGAVTLGDVSDTGRLTFSGAASVASASALTLLVDVTVSGALSGGTLTKSGAGTLTLASAGTLGGFVLDGGRVRVGANAALGSGAITLRAGALSSSSGSAITLANAISLAGDVTMGDATDNGALTLSGAVSLGGASRTLTTASGVTVSGTLSNGTLVKSGSAALTVSGANSLALATTVSEGSLVLGAAGSISDSAAITVASGGTLNLGGFSETTGAVTLSGGSITNGTLVASLSASSGSFSAILGGAGSLTKTGNGTFVLSTANTYSGSTTIGAGTLQVGSGGTAGSLGSGAVSNAGALAFNRSDAVAVSNLISGTGSVSYAGGGTYTVSSANTYEGGTTLVSGLLRLTNNSALGTGTLAVTAGTLGRDAARTLANAIAINGTLDLGGTGQDTGNLTLSGAISGAAGTTLTNKSGITLLSGPNTFAGQINVQAGDVVLFELQADDGAPDLSLTGASSRFILASAFVGQVATIGNLTGTAGTINPQYAANTGVRTLQVNQRTAGTFSGNIQDGGGSRFVGLVKTGAAALTLAGTNNTYTGGVLLSQGTLIANHGTALGSGGAVTVNDANTGSSSTSILLGSVTVARAITVANQGSGIVTLGANGSVALPEFSGAITLNRSVILDGSTNTDRLTFTGGIGGTGDVTIAGTGRVVFGGAAHTYVGNLAVSAGSILQLSPGSATATSLIPDAAVVTLGAGSFLKLAKGSNNETIGGLSGSGTVRAHEAVANATATITISNAGNHVYSGVIENGGASNTTLALAKSGAGTQALTGANTYSGLTTISEGTLQVGNGGASGSLGSGNVTNNGVLAFNRSDDVTFGNAISGSGSLSKLGNAVLTLTGQNTFSGGVSVSAGTLKAGHVSAFGTGTITLSAGSILDFSELDVANVVVLNGGSLINVRASGSVSVGGTVTSEYLANVAASTVTLAAGATANLSGVNKAVIVSGNATLTGLSTFGGSLAVSGGTLDLSDAGNRPGSGVIELRTGGTVDFGSSAAYADGIIYKGGSVTGLFTGSLNVSGTGVNLAAGALSGGKVVVTADNSVAIGDGFDRAVRLEGGSVASGLETFAGTLELGTSGTLNLTATPAPAANVVVDAGGVLRGTGTVASLTVATGGVLAPGNSPGLATVTGNLVLQAGGTLNLEILNTGADFANPVAGDDYDGVVVGGALDLTGLSLENRFVINLISLSAATTEGQVGDFNPDLTKVFDVFVYQSAPLSGHAGDITELFQLNTAGFVFEGAPVDPRAFTLFHNAAESRIQLVYAPIPEPSTYGLILGGLALAGAAIRRRRARRA